jgi:hypothetical protein
VTLKNATQLKELPQEVQVQVLAIYEETFKDSACRRACDGNCCSRCADAEGFFGGRMPRKSLDELKAKFGFTPKDGFRGPSGCNLPVEERNDICLSFMCSGSPPVQGFTTYGPKVHMPFNDKQRENGYKISSAFWQKTEAKWNPDKSSNKTRLADIWPK